MSNFAKVPRNDVIVEAGRVINNGRAKDYGSPAQNFQNIANLLNAQFVHKLAEGQTFSSADVALILIQVKMGRLMTTPDHLDSHIDIAGYAAVGYEAAVADADEA